MAGKGKWPKDRPLTAAEIAQRRAAGKLGFRARVIGIIAGNPGNPDRAAQAVTGLIRLRCHHNVRGLTSAWVRKFAENNGITLEETVGD